MSQVCDYICTTNIKDFKHIELKTPANFDSDHRLVLATLRINQQQHKYYLRKRTKNPLPLFIENNNNPAEIMFKEILAAKQEQQPKANQQQLQHDNIDWIGRSPYQDLYTSAPPTQLPVCTYVTYNIDNTAPNEDEIVAALSKIRPRKTPGASVIAIEAIKKWYHKARIAEDKN
jgi:hypothetical protein